MGGVSADMPNVDFEYSLALAAASDLSQLGGLVNDKAYAWHTEAVKAQDGWVGGHSDHFNANLGTAGTDAETITTHLGHLASLFAEQWANARGEQDRINHARWAQAQEDDDGWIENNVVEIVYDEDPGEPPPNPEPPEPPDYAPTRDPIHPEYENSGESV